MSRYAIILAAAVSLSAAAAATPEQAWKAELAQDNADYATVKHAILKINDAAYVREGQSVSLVGQPGNPSSWHWAKGVQQGSALVASYSRGHTVITKDGKTVSESVFEKGIDIVPGIDVAGMSAQIAPGEMGLRIIVYNQQNAAAKAFKGLDYFPYDPAYRVSARFKPDPTMAPHVFRTSRGWDKQFYHAGDAVFTLQGKTITLPFYAEDKVAPNIKTMTSFFTDDLTGKGAYHSGRYVDADKFGKFPPAHVTIDFNYAYNPNCARSPFYNCPFAVDNIPLAIKAGEKDPHAH
jgi:uncharacterized protein (DUF1684 family)